MKTYKVRIDYTLGGVNNGVCGREKHSRVEYISEGGPLPKKGDYQVYHPCNSTVQSCWEDCLGYGETIESVTVEDVVVG
jgi:hypothetical protein